MQWSDWGDGLSDQDWLLHTLSERNALHKNQRIFELEMYGELSHLHLRWCFRAFKSLSSQRPYRDENLYAWERTHKIVKSVVMTYRMCVAINRNDLLNVC